MTKKYNYTLASYGETKQNGWNRVCPHCGKREFTPYINVHTGEPVDERVCGKCSRENNCGYHMPPREWYALYGSKQAKETLQQQKRDEVMKFYTNQSFYGQMCSISAAANYPNHDKEDQPAIDAYFERMKLWCEESLSGDNSFTRWLYTRFPKERVDEVLQRYRIGNTDNGHIIYWQIDEDGNVRTGKVMAYDNEGHRLRYRGAFNWVHTAKGEQMFPGQCLFGEHLIREADAIGLVEAEKTALILSILVPEVTWVATGGKQNFNLDLLTPLINRRRVMILPDTDAMIEWSDKVREWSGAEFDFFIPEWYKKICEDPNVRAMKWDLADFLLKDSYPLLFHIS